MIPVPGTGSLGFAVHEQPGKEQPGMELPGMELPGVCTLIQQPPYTEYLWHRIPLPPAPDLTLVCQDATIYVTVRYIQENRMSDDLPGENRKR